MGVIGKLLGSLVLLLGGVALIACLWAAGTTSAIFSGTFFTDLSNRVVEQVPDLVDQSFAAAAQPEGNEDADTRLWLQAMEKADLTPRQIMDQSGISGWLKHGLAGTLRQIEGVLSGDIPADQVVLDLRPLKTALSGEPMLAAFRKIVIHLPACDQTGLNAWKQHLAKVKSDDNPPACNPGAEAMERGQEYLRSRLRDVPDSQVIFEEIDQIPPFDMVRTVHAFFWLLFLLPALLIALGAAMAGRGLRGFLHWSGGTVLSGSLISLLGASMISGLMLTAMSFTHTPWFASTSTHPFNTEAGQLFASHMMTMVADIMADLFTPVFVASWIALGIGVLLVVLGFVARPKSSP